MKKYIVIGAGILGASTAYRLAKAGMEVTIIDKEHDGQATDAAAGIVCPWLSQRRNQAWYQLAKGGARYYPSLIAELEEDGETETGYSRVGAISVHHDEQKLDGIEKRALKRRENAPEIGTVTRLSPDKAKTLFPPLAEGMGAVHISGAARVDGRALRAALLRAATKLGTTFVKGDAELLFEGKKITGAKIAGQKIEADTVIVTAGAWAKDLLKPLQIDFAVSSQKAQIVHLEIPDAETSKWPVVIPPTSHYLLAFDHGKIIAGATHENETGLDYRVTVAGMTELFQKALDIAPALAESTVVETRVGFRPFTPGFLPVIGPLPEHQGILVANGLGATGLTMGPYIGSELAKLALGQKNEIDLTLYDVAGALK